MDVNDHDDLNDDNDDDDVPFSTTSRPLTPDQPVWSPNCSSDEEDDESIQQRLIIDTDCEEQPITFINEILEQIQNDSTATPGVSVLPSLSG